MSINKKRIDWIIQYALLIAGQEDDFASRMLGPIHLLKYVYLADIYYAEKNNGKSFSGTNWQFYNFGPWSPEIHSRIDLATKAIMAEKYSFESNYSDDDFIRWIKSDDELLRRISREIPSTITIRLKNDVRRYGRDTEKLLHRVYKTKPMLNAAPNELLDFTTCKTELINDQNEQVTLRVESLSKKKRNLFLQKLNALKKNEKMHKELQPVTNSRFDGTFQSGVEWLESLAGDTFPEGKLKAQFSNEVWKSRSRQEH